MNKYLDQLKDMVLDSLKDEKVKVFLFGSRARGDNHRTSDVDIGLIPKGDYNKTKIFLLKEQIENSNIPYKVQVVNFNNVSEEFKMERLELKLQDAQAALKSLQEALIEPYSIYIRDATIKRFEYTFDTFWKLLKEHLIVNKGITVTSPKDCFRETFSQGYSSIKGYSELMNNVLQKVCKNS